MDNYTSPPAKRRALTPLDANAKASSPKPLGLKPTSTTPSRLTPRKAPPRTGMVFPGSPIKVALDVPRDETPRLGKESEQELEREPDNNDTRSPSPEETSLFDTTAPNENDTSYDTSTFAYPAAALPAPTNNATAAAANPSGGAPVTREQARRIHTRLRLAMYKVRTSQADKTLTQLEEGTRGAGEYGTPEPDAEAEAGAGAATAESVEEEASSSSGGD